MSLMPTFLFYMTSKLSVGGCLSFIVSFCFLLQPKIMILVLDKLTSRLKDVQNSISLYGSLCKHDQDLESKRT